MPPGLDSTTRERERIEDADCARVGVQQLAEVGFAQPAVDALAHLDADRFGDGHRGPRRLARKTWPKPPSPSHRSIR